MVRAIGKEIILRQSYLKGAALSSIYFGGGTPSLLDESDLNYLFDIIADCFSFEEKVEVTLEANPDDITAEKLKWWQSSPINRLSIGVQSFSDVDLRYMNRAHNALEAKACIEMAQAYGFENLTVDLIYGAPTTTSQIWEQNVQAILAHQIPHLSCYALTVEPQTALDHQIKRGVSPNVEPEKAAEQFQQLMHWLEVAAYEHYEISNFALAGWQAVHNGNYWKGKPYLGVGPSAHSFDGLSRQWNLSNNATYLKILDSLPAAENEEIIKSCGLYEIEWLSPTDKYNEYIMTGLRTSWGVDVNRLESPFKQHFINNINQYVDEKLVVVSGNKFVLTKKGRLFADGIASELFY